MADRNLSLVAENTFGNRAGADRRGQPRTEPEGWEAVVFLDGGRELRGRVVDFSRAGVGVFLPLPTDALLENTQVTLLVQTSHTHYTRRARICWVSPCEAGTRFGAAFLDHVGLSPDNHRLDIEKVRVNPALALKIPASLALRRRILPFTEQDGLVHLACSDLNNLNAIKTVERLLKAPVCAWEVEAQPLERIIKGVFGDGRGTAVPASAQNDAAFDAAKLGDELLYAAYVRQASDVHIDPGVKGIKIRFRVDGQLEEYATLDMGVYSELISRLKVMAKLDIAEKRSPQDGRFSHQFVNGGRRVDVRVATLPTKYGERMTLRLLALQTGALTLDRLGFLPEQRRSIERFLRRTQGMMIMTGPTGSGKTTTLYAALRMLLDERRVNIITVEDPIEYEIEGVAQCEVDTAEKLTFAKALRSILRHDPDVVMVGEIRDRETADIAIKAALTGHMVLGTLHTNSAAATVTRLADMGIEPYLVAAALRLSVAQRLIRRLCTYCRIPRPMTESEALALGRPELKGKLIHDPTGCIYCADRGFTGRIGLYEMLDLNADWARDVAQGQGEAELMEKMQSSGVRFLMDDAVEKLLAGDTSFSEVVQIAASW